MKFFRINKWEKHQHYHDRRPPWLKLYTTINDEDSLWRSLTDTELGQVARIFAYAGTCDNTMPYHAELMQENLELTNALDLDNLALLEVIEVFPDRKSCIAIETARLNARKNASKKREKISPKNVTALDQRSEIRGKRSEIRDQIEDSADSEQPAAAPDEKKKYQHVVHELAKQLAQGILNNDPKAKLPSTQKQKNGWLDAIEKIQRIDGRSWEEIHDVIKWALEDDFWHRNILSGSKLRKKFARLLLDMNAESKPKQGKTSQRVSSSKAALSDYLEGRK